MYDMNVKMQKPKIINFYSPERPLALKSKTYLSTITI